MSLVAKGAWYNFPSLLDAAKSDGNQMALKLQQLFFLFCQTSIFLDGHISGVSKTFFPWKH